MRENDLWVKQKCVILFNETIPRFHSVLYFESMNKVIVVINQSNKTKLF